MTTCNYQPDDRQYAPCTREAGHDGPCAQNMTKQQPACTNQSNAAAFGCVKNTIRLRSGLYFDLADPKPDQFTLADIAGALSKICRFGGQIDRFYSVAEHCYHCAQQGQRDDLPMDIRRALLLHDAAEAFVGDCVKPLKVMLLDYAVIEARVEAAVGEKFGVDFAAAEWGVRKIDHEMLIAERKALFSRDDVEWFGERDVRGLNIRFPCWLPMTAEARFIDAAISVGIDEAKRWHLE